LSWGGVGERGQSFRNKRRNITRKQHAFVRDKSMWYIGGGGEKGGSEDRKPRGKPFRGNAIQRIQTRDQVKKEKNQQRGRPSNEAGRWSHFLGINRENAGNHKGVQRLKGG